jgi:hypothetical protein
MLVLHRRSRRWSTRYRFKRGFSDIEFQVVPNDFLVPVQQVMTMCSEDFREERAASLPQISPMNLDRSSVLAGDLICRPVLCPAHFGVIWVE